MTATAPRPLPIRTPRPPLVLSPAASFAAGFIPASVFLAAVFAIVRRLSHPGETR